MAPMLRLLVSLELIFSSIAFSVAQTEKTDEEWDRLKPNARVASFPPAFQEAPPVSPDYMVDNTGNKRGVAPNKGKPFHTPFCYFFPKID